jgi:hypothetical protein
MSPLEEVGHQEVIWLLGSLSGLYRLPFDAALVSQEFPPPYSIATFHEAARSLGLKTGSVGIEQIDWQKLPLPAIAFLRPVPVEVASQEESPTPVAELTIPEPAPTVMALAEPGLRQAQAERCEEAPPRTPILILKSDGQKLLYFRAGSQTPETLPVAEAPQWFEPELILVAKEASTEPAAGEQEEIAGFTAEKKEFSFKWFIPELLKHRKELMELKATQDSVVKDLATHTAGTVVQPGTVLLTLVPKEETLRAEVWVSNEDIGFVRQGQPVKLKFAAFPFQKYGMVEGTVEHVSADAADGNTGSGAMPNDKAPGKNQPLVYKALIALKAMRLEMDGEKFPLSAGMQSSAEILLGTRTVAEYLLSPARKAWHEAGRER